MHQFYHSTSQNPLYITNEQGHEHKNKDQRNATLKKMPQVAEYSTKGCIYKHEKSMGVEATLLSKQALSASIILVSHSFTHEIINDQPWLCIACDC